MVIFVPLSFFLSFMVPVVLEAQRNLVKIFSVQLQQN